MHLIFRLALLVLLAGPLAAFNAHGQSAVHESALKAYQSGDYASAFEAWKTLADQGDAEAQYAIGVIYFKGEGRDQSLDEAIKWFSSAANAGHVTAMFNLGVAYWEGKGVTQNFTEAVSWWQKAAEKGDPASQYNLGLAHYLGKGAPLDLTTAAFWIKQAAENDHDGAKNVLPILEKELPQGTVAVTQPTPVPPPAPPAEPTAPPAPPAPMPADTAPESPSSAPQATSEPAVTAPPPAAPPPAAEPATTVETSTPAPSNFMTSTETPVFSALRNKGPELTRLPAGTPVVVTASEQGWSRVRLPGGVPVWVFGKYVSISGDSASIRGNGVRARTHPSTGAKSSVIGAFKRGDKVSVIASEGGWRQVLAPDHFETWVRSEDLGASELDPAQWENTWTTATAERRSGKSTASTMAAAPSPAPPAAAAPAQTQPTAPAAVAATAPTAAPSAAPSAAPRAGFAREDSVPAFASANAGSPVLGTLRRGTPVQIIETRGDWAQVQIPQGFNVWVFGRYVNESGAIAQITADKVRARSLPSTASNSAVVGVFQRGDRVAVVSRQGDWKRVRAPQSMTGWVRRSQIDELTAVSEDWRTRWQNAR